MAKQGPRRSYRIKPDPPVIEQTRLFLFSACNCKQGYCKADRAEKCKDWTKRRANKS